jgi:uncharacterized protein (AIM24 family)
MAAFATRVAGQILPIEVNAGNEYMIHRSGYLCGVPSVELSIGFLQKLGAGLFGGAGFILQRVAGSGNAWIALDGEIVDDELAAGESLRVHPGHVGMFESAVSFELDRIKGIKNMVFGGDGIFLARLTGPGHVWLQTLPLPKLAGALLPYLPQPQSESKGAGSSARSSTTAEPPVTSRRIPRRDRITDLWGGRRLNRRLTRTRHLRPEIRQDSPP